MTLSIGFILCGVGGVESLKKDPEGPIPARAECPLGPPYGPLLTRTEPKRHRRRRLPGRAASTVVAGEVKVGVPRLGVSGPVVLTVPIPSLSPPVSVRTVPPWPLEGGMGFDLLDDSGGPRSK